MRKFSVSLYGKLGFLGANPVTCESCDIHAVARRVVREYKLFNLNGDSYCDCVGYELGDKI